MLGIRLGMCDDPNILNCVARLGLVYELARYAGFLGIFIGPVLVYGAFSLRKDGRPTFSERTPGLVMGFRLFAGLTAASLVLTLLTVFPGIFFCSVYCFFGIGLPVLGASSSISAAFAFLLLLTDPTNKRSEVQPRLGPERRDDVRDSRDFRIAVIAVIVLALIVGLLTLAMATRGP